MGTPGELKRDRMTESVIEIECDDLMRAAALFDKESLFTETAIFGNRLHIVTPDADAAMQRATRCLEDAGISVTHVEIVTASLEDVFVTLTAHDSNNGPVSET